MIDWDNLEKDEDGEVTAEQIKLLRPEDFIFDISKRGDICVVITPKSYFDKYGYMYDQHLDYMIEKFLPSYLFEDMEATFIPEGNQTRQQIEQDLLRAGFKKDRQFTNFLASCS